MAEILAITHGLLLAKTEFVDNVMVFSDCKQDIQLIDQDNDFNDVYTYILKNCKESKQGFKAVKCVFVMWEHNQVANALANECQRNQLQVYDLRELPISPLYCNELLVWIVMGLSSP